MCARGRRKVYGGGKENVEGGEGGEGKLHAERERGGGIDFLSPSFNPPSPPSLNQGKG